MLSDLCCLSCPVLSVCDVCILWPNGWTDQDASWRACRHRHWPHCVRGPSSPSPKGPQPPIFGPYLLRPNGCMDQDDTWYGGRPQPRGLCVRRGPSPLSQKGAEPPIIGQCLLQPNGYMDQDAIWYGGRPRPRRHCVRWRPSSPLQKGGRGPQFRPIFIVAKRLDASTSHLLWR